MLAAAESIPGINNEKCIVTNYRKVKFPQQISIKIEFDTFDNEYIVNKSITQELANKITKLINDNGIEGNTTSISYNVIPGDFIK